MLWRKRSPPTTPNKESPSPNPSKRGSFLYRKNVLTNEEGHVVTIIYYSIYRYANQARICIYRYWVDFVSSQLELLGDLRRFSRPQLFRFKDFRGFLDFCIYLVVYTDWCGYFNHISSVQSVEKGIRPIAKSYLLNQMAVPMNWTTTL